jgi:predicted peptidase
MNNSLGFALLLILFISCKSTPEYSAYQKNVFKENGLRLPYRILYPARFDDKKKYSVLFFLHYTGSQGNDNNAQLRIGADKFLTMTGQPQFPAIIIFPQCSKESFWSNVERKFHEEGDYTEFRFKTGGLPTEAMKLLMGLIGDIESKPYVDQSRLYVMGISMGGMGALEVLRRKPNSFAAAVSICGGDNPINAEIYAKKVSIWLFHGENDPVVDVKYSKEVAKRLKSLGADIRVTTYPGIGHSSWDNALKEPDLFKWIFSKKKLPSSSDYFSKR